jgi:hypothetical protein
MGKHGKKKKEKKAKKKEPLTTQQQHAIAQTRGINFSNAVMKAGPLMMAPQATELGTYDRKKSTWLADMQKSSINALNIQETMNMQTQLAKLKQQEREARFALKRMKTHEEFRSAYGSAGDQYYDTLVKFHQKAIDEQGNYKANLNDLYQSTLAIDPDGIKAAGGMGIEGTQRMEDELGLTRLHLEESINPRPSTIEKFSEKVKMREPVPETKTEVKPSIEEIEYRTPHGPIRVQATRGGMKLMNPDGSSRWSAHNPEELVKGLQMYEVSGSDGENAMKKFLSRHELSPKSQEHVLTKYPNGPPEVLEFESPTLKTKGLVKIVREGNPKPLIKIKHRGVGWWKRFTDADEALDFLDDMGVDEDGMKQVYETYKPNSHWQDSRWQVRMAARRTNTPKVIENENTGQKWIIEGGKTRIFKEGKYIVTLPSRDLFRSDKFKRFRETEMKGVPVEEKYQEYRRENEGTNRSLGKRLRDAVTHRWNDKASQRIDADRLVKLQEKKYDRTPEEEAELRRLEQKNIERSKSEMARVYKLEHKKENPNATVIKREVIPYLFKVGDRPGRKFAGWDLGEEIDREVPLPDGTLYVGSRGHEHIIRPADYQKTQTSIWRGMKSLGSAAGDVVSRVYKAADEFVPGGIREGVVSGMESYEKGESPRDIAKAVGHGYLNEGRRKREDKQEEEVRKKKEYREKDDEKSFQKVGQFANAATTAAGGVVSALHDNGKISDDTNWKINTGLQLAGLAPWIWQGGKSLAKSVASFWMK